MKKRFLALVTAMVLAFTMILPVMAAETADVTFKIVHTNDVHSRADGEAYVSSYVKSLKEAGENVFLVSAGDVLHGQPLATVSSGKAIVDIMNAAGYDFLAPGNHDYNYGIARLSELSKSMNFTILASNVRNAVSGKAVFPEYVVKEVNGVKVGFFGLSTPETATKTNPKNVIGIDFANPAVVAAEMVEALEAEGCAVIVAVVHLGVDDETAANERSTAVAAVPGIDVVIDGHSHTVMEKGTKVEGSALIAQTGEYLGNIGVVEVSVANGTVSASASLVATPTGDKPAWAPDQAVIDVITNANKANESITSQVIGKTPVKLDGERGDVRMKETNLSALLTSAMLKVTGADIAITNGGGIRASIEAGDITKGDVLKVLPFGNFICTVNVKGSAVVEALEHGLSAYPETAGAYSQVGGIKATFDSSKEPGQRVVSVTLADGTALDPNKTYKVATNDFMAVGGDNYTMLGVKEGYMEYSSLDEALIDYIASGVDIAAIKLGAMVDVAAGEVSAPAPAPAPAPVLTPAPTLVARPTSATVYVNGEAVAFQAYNINDNNFFKLRDVAFALNGSEKQFSVSWDAANSVISLVAAAEYTADGSELAAGEAVEKAPVSTNAGVTLNGAAVTLEAYNIDGNNYFKLRDIGKALNFGVNWDGANNAISLVTAESYAE